MFNGKIHYKWSFSIAMLVITRGYCSCFWGTSVETPPSSIFRLRSVRLDTWLSDDQIDCTMLQRGGLEALSHGGIPAFEMGKS